MFIDKFMFWVADRFLDIGYKKGFVNDDTKSDIDYQFRGILWNIFATILMFAIGLILGTFKEMVIITLCFNVCRLNGSWHSFANLTYCALESSILLGFFSWLSITYTFPLIYLQILSLLSIGYVCAKTPYVNIGFEEYPNDPWQKKFDFLILSLSFFILTFYLPQTMSNAICFSLILLFPYVNSYCIYCNEWLRDKIFKKK